MLHGTPHAITKQKDTLKSLCQIAFFTIPKDFKCLGSVTHYLFFISNNFHFLKVSLYTTEKNAPVRISFVMPKAETDTSNFTLGTVQKLLVTSTSYKYSAAKRKIAGIAGYVKIF